MTLKKIKSDAVREALEVGQEEMGELRIKFSKLQHLEEINNMQARYTETKTASGLNWRLNTTHHDRADYRTVEVKKGCVGKWKVVKDENGQPRICEQRLN